MASLTRAEAEARARLLPVSRYEVRLDLTGLHDGKRLRSATRVGFTCAQPGAATFADVVAEQLVGARLNGVDVDHAAWDGERLQLTDVRAENLLEISTSTSTPRTGSGFTAPWIPLTARCMCGRHSSRTPPATSSPASTSPPGRAPWSKGACPPPPGPGSGWRSGSHTRTSCSGARPGPPRRTAQAQGRGPLANLRSDPPVLP
jgi:hypothetical protein